MSKKISEMTPTGSAPATSELALAYNGANYKITPQNLFNTVNTATSGPAMWLATSNMDSNYSRLVLGQGVTTTSYLGGTAGIGIGFRAAMIRPGVTQQQSDYIIILPSNPSLFNNSNQSLGNLTAVGGITQPGQWQLTDGGPDYQNGWVINVGNYSQNMDPVYWAWIM